MLTRIFEKYTGFFRNLKLAYIINNLLNYRSLAQNRELYRRRGLRKSVIAPIAHRDFLGKPVDVEIPWLDRPGALERLAQSVDFQKLATIEQAAARQFVTDGYMALRGFFSKEEVESLNSEIDQLRASGRAGFNYTGRKIFNVHEVSPISNRVFFKNPRLLKLLGFLLGRPAVPFQTLHFIEGSEQRPHSDSIHMTTDPPGYLVAAWVALEPVGPENGTLAYYPGSHRLPFVSTDDYDSGNTPFAIGEDSNRRYEDKIAEIIAENGLRPVPFEGGPGDVFIWHANLLHAGLPILRKGATRRSMVSHYFAEGVLCYHEMTQRPAILK